MGSYPPLLDAVAALSINAIGLILVPAALRGGADSTTVSQPFDRLRFYTGIASL
jgi:hypothetical protein